MLKLPNLLNVLIGLVVGFAIVAGALLYKLIKEEVDKSYRYIIWAQLILFSTSYIVFAYLSSFYYLLIFAVVALVSYFLVKTVNIRETDGWQPVVLGAAAAFMFALDFGKLASGVLLTYLILFSSAFCRGEKPIKKAGSLVLNFLTAFIILILFPFDKIVSTHTFFVIYSLILPLIFYQLAKEKLL